MSHVSADWQMPRGHIEWCTQVFSDWLSENQMLLPSLRGTWTPILMCAQVNKYGSTWTIFREITLVMSRTVLLSLDQNRVILCSKASQWAEYLGYCKFNDACMKLNNSAIIEWIHTHTHTYIYARDTIEDTEHNAPNCTLKCQKLHEIREKPPNVTGVQMWIVAQFVSSICL